MRPAIRSTGVSVSVCNASNWSKSSCVISKLLGLSCAGPVTTVEKSSIEGLPQSPKGIRWSVEGLYSDGNGGIISAAIAWLISSCIFKSISKSKSNGSSSTIVVRAGNLK